MALDSPLKINMSLSRLLSIPYERWYLQRNINHNVVELYKQRQLDTIKEIGYPIFVGNFVFAQFPDRLFLLDGYHRLEMIRELGSIIDPNTEVQVQIYKCKTYADANRIYEIANNSYSINGNISDQGTVHIKGEKTRQVVDQLEIHFNHFTHQNKRRIPNKKLSAPYFDINELLMKLNEHTALMDRPVNEIVQLIIDKNREHMYKIDETNRNNYRDGFYLCYGNTNCKWVEKLL